MEYTKHQLDKLGSIGDTVNRERLSDKASVDFWKARTLELLELFNGQNLDEKTTSLLNYIIKRL